MKNSISVVLVLCLSLGTINGFAQITKRVGKMELRCIVNNELVEEELVIPADAEIIIRVVNTDTAITAISLDSLREHFELIRTYAVALSSFADTSNLQFDSLQSYLKKIEIQTNLVKRKSEQITYQISDSWLWILYETRTKKRKWQKPRLVDSKIELSPSRIIQLDKYAREGKTMEEVRIVVKRVYQYDNKKKKKIKGLKKTFTFLVKLE